MIIIKEVPPLPLPSVAQLMLYAEEAAAMNKIMEVRISLYYIGEKTDADSQRIRKRFSRPDICDPHTHNPKPLPP